MGGDIRGTNPRAVRRTRRGASSRARGHKSRNARVPSVACPPARRCSKLYRGPDNRSRAHSHQRGARLNEGDDPDRHHRRSLRGRSPARSRLEARRLSPSSAPRATVSSGSNPASSIVSPPCADRARATPRDLAAGRDRGCALNPTIPPIRPRQSGGLPRVRHSLPISLSGSTDESDEPGPGREDDDRVRGRVLRAARVGCAFQVL